MTYARNGTIEGKSMHVFAFAFVALIVLAANQVLHPMRLFDRETRLGLVEERIGSVPDELMRRSSALASNFEAFRECGNACDAQAIFAERDRLVRAEWPHVFDRLMIRKDWGEAPVSASLRDRFFEDVKKHGESVLRDRCVPKVVYRLPVRGGRKVPEYGLEGFNCDTAGMASRR